MRRALTLLLLAACAPPPAPPRSPVALPEPDPALREVTRDAVESAERLGHELERVGEARFAVQIASHVEAVAVPAGTCRLFVLVGASGVTQASAALYLPDGRRVGRDLGQGGRTPAVGACSGEAPLALFWHTAVRGAGLVRGLEFALDRAAGRALGLVEPDGAIGELALALRRRGFVPRGEERRLQVARGGEERFPLALAAHRCLTLVARGADAELALLEGEGVVARDGPGGEQAVQLCAPSGERTLVARVRSSEGGEVRVHLYDADERTLGGEAALWLGERAPALRSSPDVPGARLIELSPAEVREVALPPQEGCTRVRLIAGEGSRGVWLGQPAEPERAVDECVAGARARFGSIGGGQVWLQLPEGETTPRPPAQRGARR